MPHINLKMYKGKTEEEKIKIANTLLKALAKTGVREGAISVSIEDIDKENWKDEVYNKEIANNKNLYIEPDYKM
ncbi:MAG: 4-oxalocrotonate tautomerase family protein [Lachnospirales bacterium]